MRKRMNGTITKSRSRISCLATIVLLAITLCARQVTATTYISVEPIPSRDVVGQNALDRILTVGYPNLELWSSRLLSDCGIVQNVIDALTSNGAISTVNTSNTRFLVAAGGFEAVTNPAYVFTVRDSGPNAVSAVDIDVLDNALGYVLNQGGTVHFNPDDAKAYDFSLDYAVVTFTSALSGLQAKGFFDYLGVIDPALWSGTFAGFTQIDFHGSPTNNSMLFLKPATTKQQFITGLSIAAGATPGVTYVTLNNHQQPTTAKAGVAFPGNDWIGFPNGDQYLARVGTSSPQLLNELATLRQQHLQAVANLLDAIDRGKVNIYLSNQFRCPTR
jgi:hypothetical protein